MITIYTHTFFCLPPVVFMKCEALKCHLNVNTNAEKTSGSVFCLHIFCKVFTPQLFSTELQDMLNGVMLLC